MNKDKNKKISQKNVKKALSSVSSERNQAIRPSSMNKHGAFVFYVNVQKRPNSSIANLLQKRRVHDLVLMAWPKREKGLVIVEYECNEQINQAIYNDSFQVVHRWSTKQNHWYLRI